MFEFSFSQSFFSLVIKLENGSLHISASQQINQVACGYYHVETEMEVVTYNACDCVCMIRSLEHVEIIYPCACNHQVLLYIQTPSLAQHSRFQLSRVIIVLLIEGYCHIVSNLSCFRASTALTVLTLLKTPLQICLVSM